MKKNIFLALGAFIVISFLFAPLLDFFYDLSGSVAGETPTIDKLFSGAESQKDSSETAAIATDADAYGDLPVGKVTVSEITDPVGTAILIPQNHQYPGSAAADPKNDSAEKTQAQIYDILKRLHEENGLDFIMAEGDLVGEVPETKIADLAAKIDLRNEFAVKIEKLKADMPAGGLDPELEKNLFTKAETLITTLDREIILKGAPYKLKAEGEDFKLVGSENKATRDQCADIVRNYIYEQDQLKTCSSGLATGADASGVLAEKNSDTAAMKEKLQALKAGLSSVKDLPLSEKLRVLRDGFKSQDLSLMVTIDDLGDSGNSSLLQKLQQMKAGLSAGQVSLDKEFSTLLAEARSRGENVVAGSLADAAAAYEKIKNFKSQNAAVAVSSAPSRSDNPYKEITDPAELRAMIKESEAKIQAVVIDQRNRETALNFAAALKEAGEKAGILQFGAGHEEGLVKELNAQGLNVIIIKTDEVLRREVAGE